jgi:hypothetical protein
MMAAEQTLKLLDTVDCSLACLLDERESETRGDRRLQRMLCTTNANGSHFIPYAACTSVSEVSWQDVVIEN